MGKGWLSAQLIKKPFHQVHCKSLAAWGQVFWGPGGEASGSSLLFSAETTFSKQTNLNKIVIVNENKTIQ